MIRTIIKSNSGNDFCLLEDPDNSREIFIALVDSMCFGTFSERVVTKAISSLGLESTGNILSCNLPLEDNRIIPLFGFGFKLKPRYCLGDIEKALRVA